MATVLVYYATGEGQTAKIARKIGETIKERGHEVTTVDAAAEPADLAIDDYDVVIVGASIHAGKEQLGIRDFVTANREALAGLPTAYFQVSLSAAADQTAEQAAEYVENFIEATGWQPDRIAQFGGALRFSEYGFLKRFMVKQVVKREWPELDTSQDAEFTDWQAVQDFAADVAAFAEGRLGIAPPAASREGTDE